MPSDRPPQVRRRAPSTGRSSAQGATARRRIATRPTGRDRLPPRGVRRSAELPFLARLILGGAVIALGIASVLAVTGGLGGAVAGLGSSVGDVIEAADATTLPSADTTGPIGIPTLVQPANPYVNQPVVVLSGQLPADALGQLGARIQIVAVLDGADPVIVADVAVPTTSAFTVPGVMLAPGPNDLMARVVDSAGNEGPPSVSVRYVLDTDPPRVKLTEPAEGGTVATATVEIVGKTQGRSGYSVVNEASGTTASGRAASDGTFRATIPLELGTNALTVTATDLAGNVGTVTVSVTRTGDAMAVTLTPSAYRFLVADLPQPLTLTLRVADPTGAPLAGARVTFSVSLPGVPVVSGEAITDAMGRATFEMTVPAGATPGSGPATAFVTTDDFGTASPRTVITVE